MGAFYTALIEGAALVCIRMCSHLPHPFFFSIARLATGSCHDREFMAIPNPHTIWCPMAALHHKGTWELNAFTGCSPMLA